MNKKELERFSKAFNAFYDLLYDGIIPEESILLSDAERTVKENNSLMVAHARHRGDLLISDREVIAFHLTVEFFNKMN